MIGNGPITQDAWTRATSHPSSLDNRDAGDEHSPAPLIPFPARQASPGLLNVVTAALRPALIGTVVFVVVVSGLLIWFLGFSRPELVTARHGAHALRNGEQALIDEQDALRGYLSTGEASYLTAYRAATTQSAIDVATASHAFSHQSPQVSSAFAVAWMKAQAWEDNWATPVADGSWRAAADADRNGTVEPSELAAFIDRGTASFAQYRDKQATVQEAADDAVTSIVASQTDAISIAGGAALLFGLASLATLTLGRRHLHRKLVLPLVELGRGADRVAAGTHDRITTARATPVHEVARLVSSVQTMTDSLIAERTDAADAAEDLIGRTERLQQVLEFSRELSATLSLTHVVTGLVRALQLVGGAETATVWLADWDQPSLTSFDPAHPESSETVEVGTGPIGRAAQYARAVSLPPAISGNGSTGMAMPLVIGGRTVGVVAVSPPPGRDLDLEMVDALVLHGASAIQSARMHSETEELTRRDPLTDLANRRQLSTDLAAELERAVRFGHPLSFVMIDMDHFKRLNDTYGHPRGDQVLREVAGAIRREIRAIDGAYRYGGEELALLLRESTGADAERTVERIRLSVASRFTWAVESPVSLSAGVAELDSETASASALIAAADRALYAAKRAGRNRVVRYDDGDSRRPSQRAG